AIEARVDAAEADFRAFAAGVSGSLAIGIYQSVANKVLPEAMSRFQARWPEVDVRVKEGTHDVELVDAVERGELDLTFAIQPIREGPFEVRELMRDPYVLVVAAGSARRWAHPGVSDLGRPRQRRSWRRRSPSHRISSACIPGCSLGLSGRVVRADREDQLETVDLVLLRPDLDETECAHDRERGYVGGRDRREYFRFALGERVLDEGLRRLLGESLAPKRSEDCVAD